MTRNGTSTWTGPKKTSRLSIADRSVAQIHGWPRTYRKPSPMSLIVCRTPDSISARNSGRVRMAKIATAETKKVSASTPKAAPGPTSATTRPASAGPTRRTIIWRNAPVSALACGSSCSGTTSGMIAVDAGLKNASPMPTKAISTARCHSSIVPLIDSNAIAPSATPRRMSAETISSRRS